MLPRLEKGEDLQPGLLGINVKGADLYRPAGDRRRRAGHRPGLQSRLRAGDKIVEVDGQPITRPAELKQQLGPLYAGDTIKIVALRGERAPGARDRAGRQARALRGAVPGHPADAPGQECRAVGADRALRLSRQPRRGGRNQVWRPDRAFAGKEVKDAAAVAQELLLLTPGEKVKIDLERDGQPLAVEAQLAGLPDALVGPLPPARESAGSRGKGPAGGRGAAQDSGIRQRVHRLRAGKLFDRRLPMASCVWLHAPGGFKQEELIARWKPLCEKYDFILVAPKSADPATWRPTEVRFVRRVLDEVIKNYSTDPARIVVHGHEGGGALAYVVGMASADLVRGIAVVDAPLPRMLQPPETDPVNRLAIYTTLASAGEQARGIEAGIKRLAEMKYPLTVKKLDGPGRYLTPDELEELVRWFDTLDRL